MTIEEKIIFNKLKGYKASRESEMITVNNDYSCGDSLSLSGEPSEKLRGMDDAYKQLWDNHPVICDRYIKADGKFGKLKRFVKRVIRKMTRFLIVPICEQQTEYNKAGTQCIEKLYKAELTLVDQSNKLISNVNILQNMQEEHTVQLQEKEEKIKNIERQLELQEKELNFLADTIKKQSEFIKRVEEIGVVCEANNSSWEKTTYAQSGEDAIVDYILFVLGKDYTKETYLDLGANHAKELSNTYSLYKKGMRGVLVEANPELIPELKFMRHEDVIINKCIADRTGELIKFYVMSGDGLSTFDRKNVDEILIKNPSLYIKEEIQVETIAVEDILDKYYQNAPTVVNVDVEGMELDILKQINLDAHRPLIIIVEMIEYNTTINKGKKNRTVLEFMESKNYIEYAFTGINSIFVDGDAWDTKERE